MHMTPAILAFAGSARAGSLNKKLAAVAAESAGQAGATVTLIDMRDYPIPLYDGDLEISSGMPENARALRRLMASHQGLIIASPEYNGFMTPLVKNALDWVSRPNPDESHLAPYTGKVALLLAASPGNFGGVRGLLAMRQLLSNLGVTVLPDQLAVPRAGEAFDPHGALTDPRQQETLDRMTERLVKTVSALQ